MTHTRPRGVGHLSRLNMQFRVGEKMQPASVVVMKMGDDNGLDRFRSDAQGGQGAARIKPDRPATRVSFSRVIARIYKDHPLSLA